MVNVSRPKTPYKSYGEQVKGIGEGAKDLYGKADDVWENKIKAPLEEGAKNLGKGIENALPKQVGDVAKAAFDKVGEFRKAGHDAFNHKFTDEQKETLKNARNDFTNALPYVQAATALTTAGVNRSQNKAMDKARKENGLDGKNTSSKSNKLDKKGLLDSFKEGFANQSNLVPSSSGAINRTQTPTSQVQQMTGTDSGSTQHAEDVVSQQSSKESSASAPKQNAQTVSGHKTTTPTPKQAPKNDFRSGREDYEKKSRAIWDEPF